MPKLVVLFSLLTSLTVFAEDSPFQVDVVAPRIFSDYGMLSDPNRVITEDDLKKNPTASIPEILQRLPSLHVTHSGAPGQPTSVFIRGARSEDTLVLVDGVQVNDPMSPSHGYDFSNLSAQNISRIEYYPGAQSVRYGSGAMGGVINIVTKQSRFGSEGGFLLEAGAYDTQRLAGSFAQGTNDMGYSLGGEEFRTQGFSAADKANGNTEPDGTHRTVASAKLSFTPRRKTRADLSYRFTESRTDLDAAGGAKGDDPNKSGNFRQGIAALNLQNDMTENWVAKLTAGFSETKRSNLDRPDNLHSSDSRDDFLTENQKAEIKNSYALTTEDHLYGILNFEKETGFSESILNSTFSQNSRQDSTLLGVAVIYNHENERNFCELGVRQDSHSLSRKINSLQLGGGLRNEKDEFALHFGTGFKAPNLYQLFSTYGNTNLQPEEGQSWTLHFSREFNDNLQIELNPFLNHYQNQIDFNLIKNKYFNIASTETRGFELVASVEQTPTRLQINYTYLDAKDLTTGLKLVRRPNHSGNLEVSRTWDLDTVGGNLRYIGEREDIDPVSFSRLTLPATQVVDIFYMRTLRSGYTLKTRIENLFDQRYQEVAGYGTAGISGYVGIQGDFR